LWQRADWPSDARESCRGNDRSDRIEETIDLTEGLHTLRCLTLTGINSEHRPVVTLADRMDSFVFKCPRSGMNVQHRFADESAPDGPHCTYETVLCQACSRLHFINRSSRKLLGEPEE
jgi:hypothetical protein